MATPDTPANSQTEFDPNATRIFNFSSNSRTTLCDPMDYREYSVWAQSFLRQVRQCSEQEFASGIVGLISEILSQEKNPKEFRRDLIHAMTNAYTTLHVNTGGNNGVRLWKRQYVALLSGKIGEFARDTERQLLDPTVLEWNRTKLQSVVQGSASASEIRRRRDLADVLSFGLKGFIKEVDEQAATNPCVRFRTIIALLQETIEGSVSASWGTEATEISKGPTAEETVEQKSSFVSRILWGIFRK